MLMLWTRWRFARTLFAAALVLIPAPLLPLRAAARMVPRTRPIHLDPRNPHYFRFRGRTVALTASGEHYGAVLNADFDFRKYLATLSAEGLNYTRIFGGSYVEVPAKSFGILRNDLAPQPGRLIAPWARSEVPGYAGGGNKFDLSRWNGEYFGRYRDFLAEASRLGIVVEITLFSSQYGDAQWNLSPFNPSNNVNHTGAIDWKKLATLENGNLLSFQEQYTRKLVREANGFDNVIFEIQNEPWSDRPALAGVVNPYLQKPARDTFPNSIDLADEMSLAWQSRVAQWITQEEAALPNRHLLAQNCANFRFPIRELIAGVSIANFHYAYPEAALANYGLNKAIAYDETGFLGREDEPYRREAWNFLLSGGGAFDALDYSFSPGHEDGSDLDPNGPGGGSPALRHQLGILQKFLAQFSLADLQPDFQTVRRAPGVVARVLSSRAGEYAVYLDGDGPVQLTLALPAGQYSADWFDTRTGAIAGREAFRHGGGRNTLESPAFSHGIALRLRRIAGRAV